MGNQNSGRRPKPTALKVLRGNPGQRKLNEREPTPPPGEVTKPVALTQGAGGVWDEIAPVCVAMGTLTTADVWAFKTLCELEWTLRMASSQKDAERFAPFTVGDDYNGVPTVRVHAALKLERETATTLRPYYEKFGLEPVGRARIAVPKGEPSVDKWTAMGLP